MAHELLTMSGPSCFYICLQLLERQQWWCMNMRLPQSFAGLSSKKQEHLHSNEQLFVELVLNGTRFWTAQSGDQQSGRANGFLHSTQHTLQKEASPKGLTLQLSIGSAGSRVCCESSRNCNMLSHSTELGSLTFDCSTFSCALPALMLLTCSADSFCRAATCCAYCSA